MNWFISSPHRSWDYNSGNFFYLNSEDSIRDQVMLIRSLLQRAVRDGMTLLKNRQKCSTVWRATHHCSALVYREHTHNIDTVRYGHIRVFLYLYLFISVDYVIISYNIVFMKIYFVQYVISSLSLNTYTPCAHTEVISSDIIICEMRNQYFLKLYWHNPAI